MKVLIVEDESVLRETLGKYLSKEGYVCEFAGTYVQADDKIDLYKYDIIILDVGLPDGNGLHILDRLKQLSPETGVLVVSAKNALDDKIVGLNAGADDYITKPFHLAELNARIKSLIRRRFFQGNKMLEFQEIKIDPSSNVILINDKEVVLSKKEYDLLLYFIMNKRRVLTKAAIAEHLWGDYMDLADNFDLVYSHIKNLRKKITQYGGNDYIKTIYGLGYKFTAN